MLLFSTVWRKRRDLAWPLKNITGSRRSFTEASISFHLEASQNRADKNCCPMTGNFLIMTRRVIIFFRFLFKSNRFFFALPLLQIFNSVEPKKKIEFQILQCHNFFLEMFQHSFMSLAGPSAISAQRCATTPPYVKGTSSLLWQEKFHQI